MKKFLPAILLFLAATLQAVPEIISHRPENGRIVRAIDQELTALFTFPRGTSARKLRITFDRDAPKKIVRLETPRMIELVIRDCDDWSRDDEIMQQLAGAMFAQRAGSDDPLQLPPFLLAAMRGELRGIANSQRLNRSNRWLIFLRALLAAERPIDYTCAARDGNFSPVEIYQEEAAEVLLYAARRRELLNTIRQNILQQKEVTEKLLLSLDDAARQEGFADADALLATTADQRVWHLFAPRPAALSRRRFARLTRREVDELDVLGKPTGRKVPVELEVWCGMLGLRPDAGRVRKEIQRDLREFAKGEAPESRAIITQLAALDFKPDDAPKIADAREKLTAIWQEREKVELFLAESEARYGGIGAHAPARLDALHHRTELLSARGKAFLDRVEKLYLGE